MIVISAGMQKAGTGWYFNLTNDLLEAHGGDDTRALRERSRLLRRTVNAHNCGIGNASAARLAALTMVHAAGHTFAVKTHAPPSRPLRALLSSGVARATFCYRDLRDVALSALDHGLKVGDSRTRQRMAGITNLEEALRFARTLFPAWRAWTTVPGVLSVRYEDLRVDPAGEIERLASHLGLAPTDGAVGELLDRYPAGVGSSDWNSDGLHFNQGEAGRFGRVLDADDLQLCQRILGPCLEEMGYEDAS